MDSEFTFGQMEDVMKASGKMVNKMEKDSSTKTKTILKDVGIWVFSKNLTMITQNYLKLRKILS